MSNLFDYLAWRGDLPLSQVPFCDVDGLVLSQLAYIPYEKLPGGDIHGTLRALAARSEGPVLGGSNFADSNQRFFLAAAETARFGDLELIRYAHAFDESLELQFAAVTFRLPEGKVFAAFRGTDRSLVGWKEDFMMAVSDPIPAQERAGEYLAELLEVWPGPVLAGGHSKGGNLALYASTVQEERLQRRIEAVYVNDGPGLREELFRSPGYAAIEPRLRVFMPQQALFGLLLNHPEQFSVVDSDASGILQHDPYSWQILGNRFCLADSLDRDSLYWETVFRRWLADTDEEAFRLTVDVLFRVVSATEATTIREIIPRIFQNPRHLLAALRQVDGPTRQRVMNVLGNFAEAALHQAGETYMPRSLLSHGDDEDRD